MIPVGPGAYVRPEEIAAIGSYEGQVQGQVVDVTGGKPARTFICLRSGVILYSSLSLRALARRLHPTDY